MNRVLVRCAKAKLPGLRTASYDQVTSPVLYGPDATGDFGLDNITNAIVRNLRPAHRDLLEIAAYVHLADTEIRRGSSTDVLNSRWVRQFHFVVPVQEVDLWQSPPVSGALSAVLSEVSGDRFRFTFVPRRAAGEQLYHELNHDPYPGADTVCLFSGGADSLVGALHVIRDRGERPLLISHRSSSRLDSRQAKLRDQIAVGPEGPVGHISLWLHRRGARAREMTQRTRGFLFLALAGAVAKELSIPRIVMAENGPVSLNLRKLQQSYGSTLSRTSHPRVLKLMAVLLDVIGGPVVTIDNPFIYETKREVLGRLTAYGQGALLQETVSCARTEGMTSHQPHCGVCSQCIDRRLASLAAGLAEHDLCEGYVTNMFTDALPEGEPRMQVEGHLRLVHRIGASPNPAFEDECIELVRAAAALPGPVAQSRSRLADMCFRYAAEARAVFEAQVQVHAPALARGHLPPTCGLLLAANGAQHRDVPEHLARAVEATFRSGWPRIFAGRAPANEHELQNAGEALLAESSSPWLREGPLLPYSVVTTKPDFSREAPRFFIEIKYPKVRSRLNHIVTEITSRSMIYADQGASVVFVVYDPARTIKDDDAFCRPHQSKPGIYIAVVR
jgi:7-cyano-7-deazaguanine synthase in queuosine biosynthesis